MDAYKQAAHAIANPSELISGPEFRTMLRAILQAPIDFKDDDSAEDYVKANTFGYARVIERNVHVASFFGKDWQE